MVWNPATRAIVIKYCLCNNQTLSEANMSWIDKLIIDSPQLKSLYGSIIYYLDIEEAIKCDE